MRRLIRWFGAIGLLALDGLICVVVRRKSSGAVLVARLDNIGDFVLWFDALRALREQAFPGHDGRMILVANSTWAAWAAELLPDIDVWPLENRAFLRRLDYRVRLLVRVRRAGASVVLQPRFERHSLIEDSISRVSRATRRIAWNTASLGLGQLGGVLGRRAHNEWIELAADSTAEIHRNDQFARAIGVSPKAVGADRFLLGAELPQDLIGVAYFVLFPGATWAGRMWPAERFAALASRIQESTGWKCVICGGSDAVGPSREIAAGYRLDLLNLVGQTQLSTLAAVLAGAQLVVSNETAAAHIAAAVETTAVAIVGGGHFGRFIPYPEDAGARRRLPVAAWHTMPCFGCNWQCQFDVPEGRPVPCIERVEVDRVWSAVTSACAATIQEGSDQRMNRRSSPAADVALEGSRSS